MATGYPGKLRFHFRLQSILYLLFLKEIKESDVVWKEYVEGFHSSQKWINFTLKLKNSSSEITEKKNAIISAIVDIV